jgi:hypothetical protein
MFCGLNNIVLKVLGFNIAVAIHTELMKGLVDAFALYARKYWQEL